MRNRKTPAVRRGLAEPATWTNSNCWTRPRHRRVAPNDPPARRPGDHWIAYDVDHPDKHIADERAARRRNHERGANTASVTLAERKKIPPPADNAEAPPGRPQPRIRPPRRHDDPPTSQTPKSIADGLHGGRHGFSTPPGWPSERPRRSGEPPGVSIRTPVDGSRQGRKTACRSAPLSGGIHRRQRRRTSWVGSWWCRVRRNDWWFSWGLLPRLRQVLPVALRRAETSGGRQRLCRTQSCFGRIRAGRAHRSESRERLGDLAGPTTPWWVANNGTDISTLYDGQRHCPAARRRRRGWPHRHGLQRRQRVRRERPAGHSGPALFLFASENGTIHGWNPAVPPPAPSTHAFVVVDHQRDGPSSRVSRSPATGCTRPISTTAASTSSTAHSSSQQAGSVRRPGASGRATRRSESRTSAVTSSSPTRSRTPTGTTRSTATGLGIVDVYATAAPARARRKRRRPRRTVGACLGARRLRSGSAATCSSATSATAASTRSARHRTGTSTQAGRLRDENGHSRSSSTGSGASASATATPPGRRRRSTSRRDRTESNTASSGASTRTAPPRKAATVGPVTWAGPAAHRSEDACRGPTPWSVCHAAQQGRRAPESIRYGER